MLTLRGLPKMSKLLGKSGCRILLFAGSGGANFLRCSYAFGAFGLGAGESTRSAPGSFWQGAVRPLRFIGAVR